MIGSFGEVVFKATEEQVRTFSELTRKLTARFAKHEVLNSKPVFEHLGSDAITMSFKMQLLATLGVNPKKEIEVLETMCDSGEPQSLFIGNHLVGKFLIQSLNESMKYFDNKGNCYSATVGIELIEYTETVVKSKQATKNDGEYIDTWRYQD